MKSWDCSHFPHMDISHCWVLFLQPLRQSPKWGQQILKRYIISSCCDANIWRHRSGSTLAQVIACCLTAPSHYLNQYWFIISTVQLYPYKDNFTRDTSAINHQNSLVNYLSEKWLTFHKETEIYKVSLQGITEYLLFFKQLQQMIISFIYKNAPATCVL